MLHFYDRDSFNQNNYKARQEMPLQVALLASTYFSWSAPCSRIAAAWLLVVAQVVYAS